MDMRAKKSLLVATGGSESQQLDLPARKLRTPT
jgi:hypothetical protein